MLKNYQRDVKTLAFKDFEKEIEVRLTAAQSCTLQQRLDLLRTLISDSDKNSVLRKDMGSIEMCCTPGTLVIADLTDPLLAPTDANNIFNILVSQFRSLKVVGGKVLALDEAHKYLSSENMVGLTNNVVDAVRVMRHEGMRIVISTQCPKVLPGELLELVTLSIAHKFHSKEWLDYLHAKIPISVCLEYSKDGVPKSQDLSIADFLSLKRGEAIIYANNHKIKGLESYRAENLKLKIRERLTKDLGATKCSG